MEARCRVVRRFAPVGAGIPGSDYLYMGLTADESEPCTIGVSGGKWGLSGFGRGSGKVRFVVILLVLVIAALGGLYIYGQMLEPDTRVIEQEALDVAP